MYSTGYAYQILMKPVFSWHIFEKYTNTRFRENQSCGNRVFRCRRTDKQAWQKLTVTFPNFAKSAQNFQNKSFAERKICLTAASPTVLLAIGIGIDVSEGFLDMIKTFRYVLTAKSRTSGHLIYRF
jgi:hypothetical protein